jgi:hypothetical protein
VRHAHDKRRLAALAFCVLAVVVGFYLGEGYIDRLPRHAGYFLVSVDDEVRVPIPARPRHTAFVVVDGLRKDSAETMSVTKELARAGQCRVSDQGSFTVSRPEYALLSTGLEVDRTGSRNNDLTAPLAAESIWQIARKSGLRVAGSSHLRWFEQLFPDGFDRFAHQKNHSANVFSPENGELLDVNVFHPLYVDESAHQHGAASPEYAAAVSRVDSEIAGLLARLDFSQDLVVLTADHGHRDAGGHGGAQPEIRNVLVCFAGRGVAPRAGVGSFDGRSTAPALALLLGLRFPRNMRAGDDGLDVLWDIALPTAENAGYLADRHAAVDRFRDQNRVALEGWLGGTPGTWPRLYEREARAQTWRLAAVALVVLFCAALSFRARGLGSRAALETTTWLAFSAFIVWCVHHAVLGDFDFTVINLRERFIPRAAAVAIVSAGATLVAHARIVRDPPRLAGDLLLLVALLLAMNVGHVYVYGFPLGFPLPSQAARYFPFFGAIALVTYALTAAALLVVQLRRARSGAVRK